MDLTTDAFPSTPPLGILAKPLGEPEHADWLDESLSWKQTCCIGDWSFLPRRRYSHYFRKMLSPTVLDVADAEVGTQVEVIWGNPGDPVMQIRSTGASAPFKRVRPHAGLQAHLAAYRAEFGLTA
ncbi:hypothetical protein ADK57_42565 [Streptomyces sp. MMG1533]|uniref:hypothetical protein n=1 Tax=Streptomyces sp. MMG1533 TaxID=1415546 RepID=UPI0006AFA49A|nr:hypothetical protein [Streptomyces sp. MMG1533]KOU56467.1 hypothetical protein ADK57_42565 [Streptomyces sp. MMG1533]